MTNITVAHNNSKYQIQTCDKWVPKSGCLTPLHYRQNTCDQSPLTNTQLFHFQYSNVVFPCLANSVVVLIK